MTLRCAISACAGSASRTTDRVYTPSGRGGGAGAVAVAGTLRFCCVASEDPPTGGGGARPFFGGCGAGGGGRGACGTYQA